MKISCDTPLSPLQFVILTVFAIAASACVNAEDHIDNDTHTDQRASALSKAPQQSKTPRPLRIRKKSRLAIDCSSSIELVELSEQCVLVYESTDNASFPIEEICLDEAPISFSLQQFGDGCMTLVAETGSPYGPDMYGPFCPEQCPTTKPIVVGCQEGDTKLADDGCNSCGCNDGQWVCTMKGCGSPAPVCEEGTVEPADDGCNSCVCKKGQWACTLMLCPDDSDEGDTANGPPVDCDGNHVPDSWQLLGNGVCQDGSLNYNLNCAEWDFDGGDCSADDGGDNGSGPPVDCNGTPVPDWWKLGVYGDGVCTDNEWINFNCADWQWDGGDCEIAPLAN